MFSEHSLDLITATTEEAVKRKCKEFLDGDIVSEDDFSSSLLSSLRDGLNGLSLRYENTHTLSYGPAHTTPYRVHARTTSSRHVRSEENLSGADIMMGFRGTFDGLPIVKTALLQAKLLDDGGTFSEFPSSFNDRKYLYSQCKRMVRIAGRDAYVIIYSVIGVRFYPASEYIRNYQNGLSYDSGVDFPQFVRGLFECSIGNPELNYMSKGRFRQYLEGMGIKHGFEAELEEQ